MSQSTTKLSAWKSLGIVAIGALGLIHLLTRKSNSGSKSKGKRLVGIELGGTNSKIALIEFSNSSSENIGVPVIIKRAEIKTSTPEETLAALLNNVKDLDFEAIGIASFGPLNLNKKDPGYGTVTSTPKQGWQNFKMLDFINKQNSKPISIDTDVGAAAAAEYILGNHGVNSLVYVTVGTGVGIGIVSDGKILHGLTHPEGGHICVRLIPEDKFEGVCPYHKNCLEGLTTNQSIGKRFNIDKDQIQTIDENDDVWRYVANYLAQLCLNLTLTLSPEVIIMGGGVLHQKNLLTWIKKEFTTLLNDYVQHPKIKDIDNYIKTPFLKDDVGLIGGALLTLLDN